MEYNYNIPVLRDARVVDIEKEPKYQRREINKKDFVKRSAIDSDYDELIKENFILREKGKPIIVYLNMPELPSIQFVNVLSRIKYLKNYRSTGLSNTNVRIFGYMPRETIRKDYCSSTSFAYEDPQGHAMVCDFASTLTKFYKAFVPDMFKYHNDAVKKKVKEDWIIKDSPFTSGIINKNNPLKYHFDRGNISKVFSNMFAFKRNCPGGHLSIPEFKLGLEIANKTMLLFDGQSIMHGVTPFKITAVDGYRYTIVYYTLKQMWHCESVEDELSRIKKRKTEREMKRYRRLQGMQTPEELEAEKGMMKIIR